MDGPDLHEIRALLRTSPAMVEPRSVKPLVGGLKRMLKRSTPTRPPAPAKLDVLAALPAVAEAPSPSSDAPTGAVEAGPPLIDAAERPSVGAPRRALFGLAERKAEPPPALAEPEAVLPDPDEPIVVPRRRATDVDAIGAAEVMELRELLAERLPALLTPDLLSVLEPPAIAGEPDAAPAPALEAAAVADPPPAATTGPSPDWSRRAICLTPARGEAIGEQAVLGDLYAQLCAEHDRVRDRLAALAPEPVRSAA